ncbi:MAG: hypothetical protein IJX91_00440 [Clostridia bacterium]|nr:hypothetical protein [Clostridia bacterium]
MKNKKFLGFLAAIACLGCLAGCKDDSSNLDAAKSYLDGIYKPKATVTAADAALDPQVIIDGETYTITWSVNVESGVKIVVNDDGTVTLDIDENAAADVNYVLTATIKDADGNTIQTSYDRTVPKFKELTWSEFMAKNDQEAVVVKGVISAIINTESNREIYMEDSDGGYYIYGLEAAQLEGLQVGMEIRARGLRKTYYGVAEVVDAGIEILNATPVAVTPTDITTIFSEAASTQAETLTALQSRLVTIKGVTIVGQDASNSSYYNFKLGDKQSYVRISSSACILSSDDQKTFKDTVAASKGYSADVTGIVSIYNNKVYLIPVSKDAYSNITKVERTDAEKVAFEKEFVSLPSYGAEIMADLTLPTCGVVYDDVTVSWTSSDTSLANVVVDKDGNATLVVTLPKDEAKKVTLTATITSGEATDTLEFKDLVVAKESINIPEAITAAPTADTDYGFYLYQGNLNKKLYLTGEMDGNYLEATPNPDLAATVRIEPIENTDTFYLRLKDSSYISINATVNESTGKTSYSVSLDRKAATAYKWSEEYGTIVTADGAAYLGTFSSFETISASELSYISTSFPAQLCTFIDKTTATDEVKAAKELKDLAIDIETYYSEPTTVTLPTTAQYFDNVTISWASDNATVAAIDGDQLTITPAKTATTVTLTVTVASGEKKETKTVTINVDELTQLITVGAPSAAEYDVLYMDQLGTGQRLYLAGGESSGFLNTTTNANEAVTVGLEAVAEKEDTYYLYYLDGEAKKYVEIYKNSDSKIRVRYSDTAVTEYTYSEKYATLVSTFESNEYYLGTYDTFTTVGASKTSFLDTSPTNYVTKLGDIVKYSEITDDTKIAAEKEALATLFDSTISEAKTYTLPAVGSDYSEVAITWEVVGGSDIAQIDDGVLSIAVPNFTTTVSVKATFTIGETTDSKTFEIEALKNYTQAEIVDMAYELENDATLPTNFTLTGTIISVDYAYSTTNKNLTVTMVVDGKEDKPIQCYKLVGDGAETDSASLIGVGDSITVTGILKNFKGTIEFDQGCTLDSYNLDATVSEAAKVATEKYELAFAETEFTNTASVTLPAAGTTYTDVAITWTTESAAASIADGVLTVAQVSETTTVTVTASLTLGETTYTKDLTITVTYVSADSIVKKYTFSDYTAGTQYAEDEAHVLDDYTTVTTTQAHFTTELRLYSSSSHDAFAIISCTNVIDSITLNCGNKADTLNVYGSTDGTTWTLIEGVSVTSSYADYTVNITNSTYKYLKLDVAGTQQVRVAYMTITMTK